MGGSRVGRGGEDEPAAFRGPVLVWLAVTALSTLGDSAWSYSLNWTGAGQGGRFAGVVNAIYTGVLSCFLLFGGVVGDRLGQRRLIARSLVLSIVALVCFVGCWRSGFDVRIILLAWAAVSAGIAGLRTPSQVVFIRQLTHPSQTPRVMSANSSIALIMRVLGPWVGGMLIAAGGMACSALVNAATFVLVLIVVLRLKPLYPPPAPSHDQRAHRSLVEGLATAVRHPTIMPMLVALLFVAGGFLPVTSLGVPLLAHSHGWSSGLAGALVTASTLGSLVVSLGIMIFRPYHRPVVAMVSGAVVAVCAVSVLAASGGNVTVAAIALFFSGAGVAAFSLHLSPLFVMLSPASLQSRFASLLSLAQMLPTLCTSLLIGAVSDRWGAPLGLAVCAVIGSVALVPLLVSSQLRKAVFP